MYLFAVNQNKSSRFKEVSWYWLVSGVDIQIPSIGMEVKLKLDQCDPCQKV